MNKKQRVPLIAMFMGIFVLVYLIAVRVTGSYSIEPMPTWFRFLVLYWEVAWAIVFYMAEEQ